MGVHLSAPRRITYKASDMNGVDHGAGRLLVRTAVREQEYAISDSIATYEGPTFLYFVIEGLEWFDKGDLNLECTDANLVFYGLHSAKNEEGVKEIRSDRMVAFYKGLG